MKHLVLFIAFTLFLTSCDYKRTTLITLELSKYKTVVFNGVKVQPEYILEYIEYMMKGLDGIERSQFEVRLVVSGDTKLGMVSDVKKELKEVGIWEFDYLATKE